MKKSIITLLCAAFAWMSATAQDKSDESPLSLGLQGGVGYMTTTGSLHNDMAGGATFSIGLTADYNRLRLKADFDYSQPNLRNRNIFSVFDENGKDAQLSTNSSATQTMLGVQLGYKVYSVKRLTITPAAGIFFTRYGWGLSDVEWKLDDKNNYYCIVTGNRDVHMSHVSWIASVDFDIKLGEKFTTEPFFLNQRYSRLSTCLRVTPWVAAGKLKDANPAASGLYLGATLRITGFMQSLGF